MTTPANECYRQIKALCGIAIFDWGVLRTRPIVSDDGLTLTMKSSGYVKWKGYVGITYNRGTDMYDIECYRMRKPRKSNSNPFPMPEKKVDNKVDGVFVDQLISVIDSQVLSR